MEVLDRDLAVHPNFAGPDNTALADAVLDNALRLTLACQDYDRTRGLIDGRIRPEGIDLRYMILGVPESFFRMLRYGEFDVSEMSLSFYTRSLFLPERPLVAIPVFPSRTFRHSSIYVNVDSGIESPTDLKGKRVGCAEYSQTAAVWIRGILADYHEVPIDSVTYITGGLEQPGRQEMLPLPTDISVERIPDGLTLSSLLEHGEIDAIYGGHTPSCFAAGAPNVRRLFDGRTADREYFARSGIFPIMHTVAIRRDVLADNPWVAQSLVKAFEAAKTLAFEHLGEVGALQTLLPWQVDEVRTTRDFFGSSDWWPYGVEPNRTVLETFLRYSHEQGLTPRRLGLHELFAPSTYETSLK